MKKSLFGLRIPKRSIMVNHGEGSQQRAKIRWQEWKAEALHPSCEDKAETTNWKGLEVLNLKSSPTPRGVLSLPRIHRLKPPPKECHYLGTRYSNA